MQRSQSSIRSVIKAYLIYGHTNRMRNHKEKLSLLSKRTIVFDQPQNAHKPVFMLNISYNTDKNNAEKIPNIDFSAAKPKMFVSMKEQNF